MMGYDTTGEREMDRLEPHAAELSVPRQFPKVCGRCCRSHTEAQWAELPIRGRHACLDDAGRPYVLQVRACLCGQPVAMVLP